MTLESRVPASARPETPTLLRRLLGLAIPTVIARAGILVMGMVDVIMVGRHSTAELAYASLGNALFVALLVTGVGLMIGVIARTSQKAGQDDWRACGGIWRDALPWALLVGSVSMLICFQGETLFALTGQSPEFAESAGEVARLLAPGLLGYSFFVASTFFLEGIGRPRPGMIAMVVANLLNIALNWVFIYGNLGAPEMGAAGSALTTALVRCFLGAVLVWYVLTRLDTARFGLESLSFDSFRGWWARSAIQRRIGYGGGVSVGLETCAHAALIQFAGKLGAVPVAAYAIAHNVEAVLFMAALGMGAATGVMVGSAWGRSDPVLARVTGLTGLRAGLAGMAVAGALLFVFRHQVVAVYSTDSAVQIAAAPILALACLAVLADAGQMILGQSVRAMGDVWPTTLRYLIAFWGVMVPLGYMLSMPLGLGALGLMLAVLIGCTVAMALQYLRFRALLASAAKPEAVQ